MKRANGKTPVWDHWLVAVVAWAMVPAGLGAGVLLLSGLSTCHECGRAMETVVGGGFMIGSWMAAREALQATRELRKRLRYGTSWYLH